MKRKKQVLRIKTGRKTKTWIRFGVAVAMLALIGSLGLWSATIPSLGDWNKMFLHSFEILFWGVVGGLLGVKSSTKG